MPELTGLSGLKLDTGLLAKSVDPALLADRMGPGTIATTGVSVSTMIAKYAGTLASAIFTSRDGLAADNTNYITFAIVNRTNGAAAMLAATDPNTTKLTGGAAIVAYAKRTLVLNGTPANLAVAAGDVIEITATATGTLTGTVTGSSTTLTITPS